MLCGVATTTGATAVPLSSCERELRVTTVVESFERIVQAAAYAVLCSGSTTTPQRVGEDLRSVVRDVSTGWSRNLPHRLAAFGILFVHSGRSFVGAGCGWGL